MTDPLEEALKQRIDLDQYGAAKRTLFALQMTLDIEDIHSVAATALTDGPDDKSCDVVFIDRDSQSVILAQGYESGNNQKLQAPLGKASSLHQAVNWLFGSQHEEEVPERLQSAWRELHDALADGAIGSVEIWFVHNLPENHQIEQELSAVAKAAHALVANRYPSPSVDFVGKELGRESLLDRYKGSLTPILVTDEFTVKVDGSFVEEGDNYTALCTSVPASWLRQIFSAHQERLFSANVRGYLGSRRSKDNINNGIRTTASESPKRFWAYNNGITAIVNEFSVDEENNLIKITGMAIVNGAQTTGALGSIDAELVEDGRLLARFIKCGDPATVKGIIRYNNRQNPTEASDFRSNDRIQVRLVKEFSDLGVAGYNGGRRGGAEDVIRRPGENQISASVAAQALAAFHGGPDVAYHEKGQIWESDVLYGATFTDRTDAQHIIFVYSLLKSVEKYKSALAAKSDDKRTASDSALTKWFALRGSTFLAVAAIGNAMEAILGYAVTDRYSLKFSKTYTISDAIELWTPIVSAILALAPTQLEKPLKSAGGLRNSSNLSSALEAHQGLVDATKAVNDSIYTEFAAVVEKVKTRDKDAEG
ncbi:AIPR family protein [Amycolatopsis japonica]